MKRKLFSLLILSGLLAHTANASLDELFPEPLEDAKGNPVARETLDGKLIGVYFSAQWCGPCRNFTPRLVEFRNKHQEDFEVVFVSSDRTPDDQRRYMAEYKMDFLTLPHRSDAANALAKRFSVRGIPRLVILDSEGNVIRENGRGEVTQHADTALQTWKSEL